jgi:hypothetical protein
LKRSASFNEIRWHRDALTFGVHALRIGVVVLLLRTIGRLPRRVAPRYGAHEQAYPRTHARTLVPTRGCACGSTDCGAYYGRFEARIVTRLLCARTTDLSQGIVAANGVIRPELFKTLPRTG